MTLQQLLDTAFAILLYVVRSYFKHKEIKVKKPCVPLLGVLCDRTYQDVLFVKSGTCSQLHCGLKTKWYFFAEDGEIYEIELSKKTNIRKTNSKTKETKIFVRI
ncbi:hypothetical protein [Candidatus Uabimicrobium sp. HlEnr_7]|uniref:hypothetical protein n=1 Tax=Candidatus Uabimicrobium helgolandensis TaxID=3095367 RepID=UPI0035573D20